MENEGYLLFRGLFVKILFERVSQKDRSSKMFYYEMRHADDWSQPVSLEKFVFCNFFGTLISSKKISDDTIDLTPDESFRISMSISS